MSNLETPTEAFFPATLMPDPDWWSALWPDPCAVLAALGLSAGQSAVDLCCGNGHFTAAMGAIARDVTAIDLDAGLIEQARERCDRSGLANCTFVRGDAYRLGQLVGAPVDFVLMANTFHGVPDKPRLAAAVASVLKPDGWFAVVNWHKRPREQTSVLDQPRGPRTELRMSSEEVTASIADSGLRRIRDVELPPYHYGALFQRLNPGTSRRAL